MDDLPGLSMERDNNEEQDEVDILVPGMGTEIFVDIITLLRRLLTRNLFCSSA
jgi:hypothetical protein